MNKPIGYGAASLAALALLVVTARQATTQVGGSSPAFVKVQATTPGTAQPGHANLTGTSIAGQHVGGGAGLTGLDAGAIGLGLLSPAFGGTGLDTSATAAGSLLYTNGVGTWGTLAPGNDSQVLTIVGGLPTWGDLSGGLVLPYTGTADVPSPNAVFKLTNTNTTSGSALWGETAGTNGVGVYGSASASSGNAGGGWFQSASTSGFGVFGYASANSGITYGLAGQSASTDGIGVSGYASAASGLTSGVRGISDSTNGRGRQDPEAIIRRLG